MALDPRQRQKKVERRKAKERSKKQSLKVYQQKIVANTVQSYGESPILHCCVSDTTWIDGMGHALLSRELPNRQVAISTFLLDMHCLGVKDAMFVVGPRSKYEREIYGSMAETFEMQPLQPECLRKLVEGAVEYARDLGFEPQQDYGKARLIFGNIDAGACQRQFEYGKDGKPLFTAGPNDNAQRCRWIIATLTSRCGLDGFDFITPLIEGMRAESELPSSDALLLDDDAPL